MFQVLASQCLTALCASAGGGEGCTVAEQPEIDVLLNALLSPCFSVRDAALRVSFRSVHFNIFLKMVYHQEERFITDRESHHICWFSAVFLHSYSLYELSIMLSMYLSVTLGK